MVAFLARPGRAQNLDAARADLCSDGGRDRGQTGVRSRLEAARADGPASPTLFDRELRQLLEDDDPEVVGAAIRAVGQLGKRSLPALVDRLARAGLTDDVVEALARMGDRVVGTLRDHLVDPDTAVGDPARDPRSRCRRSARRPRSTC